MPTDNDYDQLGRALSEKLHAMDTPIIPSKAFEARLERVLASTQSESSASHRRRWALGALIPAVASSVAAILLLAASDSSPAFAVTRGGDGTVKITLNDIGGVSGANAKLRELGVTNVAVVPIAAGCTTQIAMSYIGTGSPAGSTVTITPSSTPAGTTTVLAAEERGQGQIEEAIGQVSGAAPDCVAPAPSSSNGEPTGPVVPQTTTSTSPATGA